MEDVGYAGDGTGVADLGAKFIWDMIWVIECYIWIFDINGLIGINFNIFEYYDEFEFSTGAMGIGLKPKTMTSGRW